MGHTLNRIASWQENNQQPSLPQHIATQRSHFRGALLGLTLAPTAVSLARTGSGANGTTDGITNVSATMAQWLPKRIEHCLAQVRHFLASTPVPSGNGALGSASTLPAHDKTWLDAVPILLRYYNHPASHSLWKADAATTAQYWMLSDILAKAMSGQTLSKAWLKQQAQQVTQTKDASLIACHYRWLWNALADRLLPGHFLLKADCYQVFTPLAEDDFAEDDFAEDDFAENNLASNSPTPHEISHHRTVVTGIACALACIDDKSTAVSSASYGLAVSMATQNMSASTDREALLIAGLVSGAIVGYSHLPVLWQRTASDIALADALFDQWAGAINGRTLSRSELYPEADSIIEL